MVTFSRRSSSWLLSPLQKLSLPLTEMIAHAKPMVIPHDKAMLEM
jgi:hypothetical protein